MKKNNQKSIILFFLFISSLVFGQQSKLGYVVITYEINRNKDQHSAKNYYWIVPIDSLRADKDFKKYPLYFEEFSKNDLKDCSENRNLTLFTLMANEDFNIDDKIKSDIESLKDIVKKKRKKVEGITKKWSNGYKEKVTVYVTPIKGDFCSSNLSLSDEKIINYKGLVYLPIGNFSFNYLFYETDKFKDVKFKDYMDANYINSL